jgi:hypothetical protein
MKEMNMGENKVKWWRLSESGYILSISLRSEYQVI